MCLKKMPCENVFIFVQRLGKSESLSYDPATLNIDKVVREESKSCI